MRCAERTRIMSLAFSNETVISGVSSSPRSSLRARSRARSKKPLAPPPVTRTLTLTLLFIFGPPEVLNFFLKTIYERFITGKSHFFNLSHKMTVVMAMAIVVTKHAPVVHAASARVYVCKTVLHHPAALIPNFFSKHSAAPFAGQI